MDKSIQLDRLAKAIESCSACKAGKSGKAVPGEGNPDAEIVFIGEAPGKTEAKTGRPFVGRSGQLLRSSIREIGLREDDVYITSPVKYLPDRGTPSPEDIAHGRQHLERQLVVIEPKLVVLLGRVAAQALLGEKVQVLKAHGTVLEKSGKTYFLTIHPAAAIRFQKFRSVLKEDFQKLKQIIETK